MKMRELSVREMRMRMRMSGKIRFGLFFFFFSYCVFSLSAFAQQDAPPGAVAPPSESEKVAQPRGTGRRISIDVVVTDKSGKPVPGLQQQDFTLLDDKQPQPILSFHATDETNKSDPPVQAIFLIDSVNSGLQGVGIQRQQLEKFLRQSDGPLPIPTSLVFLADKSTDVQPVPTRDGKALASSLESSPSALRIIGRTQGFYGGVERLQISLRALEGLVTYEATQPGKKLLVWLSAGWPLLSGPGVQLSSKTQEFIFNTIVGLSATMREAGVTLYSVDPAGMSDAGSPRTFYYETFLEGVRSANKAQDGNLGLQVLAAQSGGKVLNSTNDIASAIAACLVDAKAFYTLSFDSPPADHPNEFHSLQVKVDKHGLSARTRMGYYAQR
jgi:VWFA-related protein